MVELSVRVLKDATDFNLSFFCRCPVSSQGRQVFFKFLQPNPVFFMLGKNQMVVTLLTLFRMGLFRVAYEWGGGQKGPLPKICKIYPTMMKPATVIPYLRNIKNYINHVTHSRPS